MKHQVFSIFWGIKLSLISVMNPLTPEICLKNSLYCLKYNSYDVREFGIGSTNHPLVDILLYSNHFHA